MYRKEEGVDFPRLGRGGAVPVSEEYVFLQQVSRSCEKIPPGDVDAASKALPAVFDRVVSVIHSIHSDGLSGRRHKSVDQAMSLLRIEPPGPLLSLLRMWEKSTNVVFLSQDNTISPVEFFFYRMSVTLRSSRVPLSLPNGSKGILYNWLDEALREKYGKMILRFLGEWDTIPALQTAVMCKAASPAIRASIQRLCWQPNERSPRESLALLDVAVKGGGGESVIEAIWPAGRSVYYSLDRWMSLPVGEHEDVVQLAKLMSSCVQEVGSNVWNFFDWDVVRDVLWMARRAKLLGDRRKKLANDAKEKWRSQGWVSWTWAMVNGGDPPKDPPLSDKHLSGIEQDIESWATAVSLAGRSAGARVPVMDWDVEVEVDDVNEKDRKSSDRIFAEVDREGNLSPLGQRQVRQGKRVCGPLRKMKERSVSDAPGAEEVAVLAHLAFQIYSRTGFNVRFLADKTNSLIFIGILLFVVLLWILFV